MKTNFIGTIIRGMAMGMAEAVPGVSGGTIAFISGIYQRLIDVIRNFGPDMFKSFVEEGVPKTFQKYDLYFLSILLGGMLVGLIIGVFGVHYFLEKYPPVVWAFFFGLILASVYYLYSEIRNKNVWSFLFFVVGAAVSLWIITLNPTTSSTNLAYVFLSGFVAISALMLPGVRGSYILLLMGMYVTVTGEFRKLLSHWNSDSFVFLLVFAMGCLLGVMTLSRLLSYLFKTYRNQTISVLTGIVFGSLPKIWPWQNPVTVIDTESGEKLPYNLKMPLGDRYEVVKEMIVWPADYFFTPHVTASIVAIILGILLVVLLGNSSESSL